MTLLRCFSSLKRKRNSNARCLFPGRSSRLVPVSFKRFCEVRSREQLRCCGFVSRRREVLFVTSPVFSFCKKVLGQVEAHAIP